MPNSVTDSANEPQEKKQGVRRMRLSIPSYIQIRDFGRNIAGRFQLFCVLFKWDKTYQKEIILTVLALMLINYSFLDMDDAFDYIALTIELIILSIQFGSEFSILPVQYRPSQGGIVYKAQQTEFVQCGGQSYHMSDIEPPNVEKSLDMYNPATDLGMTLETPLKSDILDDHIMTTDYMPYDVISGKTSYIYSVHQIRYLAIRVANKVQHTTNGEKLSLFASADALMHDTPIPVRKSYYFDALLTAEAFRSRIMRTNLLGKSEIYTDMTDYYPATTYREDDKSQPKPRLDDDYYLQVSGHIGVTSLLFSENRRVCMLYQGTNKAMEAKKIALGGSGSMDFTDIDQSRPGQDLRDGLRNGMAREIAEETGMKKYSKIIKDNTIVTGFFHWMNRSAKPEFVGITKAGPIPFGAQSKIDGDEITRFEELPVTVNKLEDFDAVLEYAIRNQLPLSLSSFAALHRMSVIADYNRPEATQQQKEIFTRLSRFLFDHDGV